METILAVLTAITLLSHPAVTVETYPVTGSTRAEVMASMRANRPEHDGWTRWRIDWTWPNFRDPVCELAEANVDLTVTVILPRWDPPADADPDLRQRWERFVFALAEHEAVHVAIALLGLADMREAIQQAGCLMADQAAVRVIAAIKGANAEYDRVTRHGSSRIRYP